MIIGKVNTPNAGAEVEGADGIKEISQGSTLMWGDVVRNNSATPLEIRLDALEANQSSNLLVIQPGGVARLEQLGGDVADVPNRTKVVALTEGVELFEISDDINTAVLEQEDDGGAAMGLVGAGMLGGSGLAAALLGAGAVGAYLFSDDDNDGTTATAQGLSDTRDGGLAGGLQATNTALEETPLAPVTTVTGELPAGLVMVGDALGDAGAQDPTGVANLLAETVGNSDSQGSADDGLVGLAASTSNGLSEGAAGTPLEPVIVPLASTVGSDSGTTSGVALGLGAVGTTLANDESPLAPLTAEVLAPVVGDGGGANSGLSNTVFVAGDGIEALTSEDSALAPLAPVTGGVVTGTDALATGLDEGGDAIYAAGEQDPSGLALLAGDLLGGDATGTEPPSAQGGQPNSDESNPLAPITGGSSDSSGSGDASDNSEPAGLAGGVQSLSGGIEETPLAPLGAVTDAVGSGLLTLGDGIGGVSENDPSGLSVLLSEVVGNSSTAGPGGDGVVGLLHAVATGLDEGTAGTPLEALINPIASLLGEDGGLVTGVADGVAAVGTTLGEDESFLSPVTSDILSPIVGDNDAQQSGLANTLDQIADGLDLLTAEGSALAPLAPLTDGVGTVLETVAGGVDQGGDAIYEAGAQDPSGLVLLVGDLLGGDATGTDAKINSQSSGSESTIPSPLDLLNLG